MKRAFASTTRCSWVPSTDTLYCSYHDEEWGRPIRGSDDKLFEMLCLEGCQAGLSWITVLRKREMYRTVFYGFEIEKVSRMTDANIAEILINPGVIRHKGKLEGIRQNAKALLELRQDTKKSFEHFVWSFAPNNPKGNTNAANDPVPEAELFSKELKKRGFKFVGPIICHAFFQAVGILDDHSLACFLYKGGKEENAAAAAAVSVAAVEDASASADAEHPKKAKRARKA